MGADEDLRREGRLPDVVHGITGDVALLVLLLLFSRETAGKDLRKER